MEKYWQSFLREKLLAHDVKIFEIEPVFAHHEVFLLEKLVKVAMYLQSFTSLQINFTFVHIINLLLLLLRSSLCLLITLFRFSLLFFVGTICVLLIWSLLSLFSCLILVFFGKVRLFLHLLGKPSPLLLKCDSLFFFLFEQFFAHIIEKELLALILATVHVSDCLLGQVDLQRVDGVFLGLRSILLSVVHFFLTCGPIVVDIILRLDKSLIPCP